LHQHKYTNNINAHSVTHHNVSLSQSLTLASFFRCPLQPWTQHWTLTSLWTWTIISRCRCMRASCVAQHTASRASYVRSCNRCRLMWPRQVVHAINSSRCCVSTATSLLYGISDILFRCLQAVQNAAARLVNGTQRCDYIIQVLQQLHWLPVRQRVEFKLAVLRSTIWCHQICQMIASSLPPPGGRRQLRSSDNFKCTIMQLYQFTP